MIEHTIFSYDSYAHRFYSTVFFTSHSGLHPSHLCWRAVVAVQMCVYRQVGRHTCACHAHVHGHPTLGELWHCVDSVVFASSPEVSRILMKPIYMGWVPRCVLSNHIRQLVLVLENGWTVP